MNVTVIDVREADEFKSGHVHGALNIPLSQLVDGTHKLDDISKDQPIITYCRSGNRSQIAINILKNKGFSNLTNGVNQSIIDSKQRYKLK